MKTKIIQEIKKGKYFYYELEDTIFFVEGGGQMKDEGTINGIEVLSCFENEGHVYHQTAKPIIGEDVELWIDDKHRYISSQGHTAQHLLSAAMYDLYGISTVSHHYNLEGSYIDVDSQEVSEEMLSKAEDWVNQKIREHHEVEILYPTKEEFEVMPIHHTLKVDSDIRIVHIVGVEYNPCKGMHVKNTSEVQCLFILGTEIVKGNVRIHYMFGEVARHHFHTYQCELKKVSVQVSKPMGEASDGVASLKASKDVMEKQYNDLATQYVQILATSHQHDLLVESDLEGDLLNKFCLALSHLEDVHCYVVTSKQVIAISSTNQAKVMFDTLKENFNLRGGGNPKICRGTSTELNEIKIFVKNLKKG